jgi:hypothetical protein
MQLVEQYGGKHCIIGTVGHDMCLPTGVMGSREHIVDSHGLNKWPEEKTVPGLVSKIRESLPAGVALKVGVIGVWTELCAFTIYELFKSCGLNSSVIPGKSDICTCSSLTASRQGGKLRMLEHLEKFHGVPVCSNIVEFSSALLPHHDSTPPEARLPAGMWAVDVTCNGENALSQAHLKLTEYLYRGCSKVRIKPVGVGYSDATVWFGYGIDRATEVELAPTILKLGPIETIARERAAIQTAMPVLGNSTPTLLDWAEAGGDGGMKIAFAAMGKGSACSLGSIIRHVGVDDATNARARAALLTL